MSAELQRSGHLQDFEGPLECGLEGLRQEMARFEERIISRMDRWVVATVLMKVVVERYM